MIDTEMDFLEKAPFVYEKLFPYKEVLSNRARKDESNWWHLSEPRAWQMAKKSRLISTEFGNSSSFAIDVKGHCVVERGHAWQPRKIMKSNDYYFI